MKFTEDIINEFLLYTEKERTLTQVCDFLDMSELEVMGLIYYMKENGINIATKNKEKTIYMINKGDLVNQNDKVQQFFSEDDEFKFVVIADTRLGSKYQQLGILNNIYQKAYNEGYHNVFLCGNISSGVYNLKDDRSEMNFINDPYDQINYIVENYPKVEGITTYFITGPLDARSKKVNIGQRIADERDDMIFLGKTSAVFKIENDKVKLITNVLTKPYTQSKRIQDHIFAERSEDKPRMLFSAGLMQIEMLLARNVYGISVPSVCATTKEMSEKRYSNTIGGLFVTVKVDEKGHIVDCVLDSKATYKSLENDYLYTKQLKIEHDSDVKKLIKRK